MSAEGLGMLGKGHDQGRYNTSKTYDHIHAGSSTFGFRGEALASAMELSCLEISSRTVRSRESRSVIIKGGEQLYLGPSVRWRRERPGTTVVARDIFYNVPVRRKSHPNSVRTLELAKKELETLALVFPHVSFSMDHTHAGQKNRILTIPQTTSSLATFRALYGKALVEHAEEINLRSEDLRLEGFINLEGSQSRGFQNFYVNRHPMAFGDIQRAVEKCFASSAFSRLQMNKPDLIIHPTHVALPRKRKGSQFTS
ncbi:hypothetical protein FS749_001762 [Ceratobasidium sp. UAMH 11750]|nr:hypothetical protein FS749_001762 [Ceratobasidium sp. UAMH 11750]